MMEIKEQVTYFFENPLTIEQAIKNRDAIL